MYADRVFAGNGYCLKVITSADGLSITSIADGLWAGGYSVIAYCLLLTASSDSLLLNGCCYRPLLPAGFGRFQ